MYVQMTIPDLLLRRDHGALREAVRDNGFMPSLDLICSWISSALGSAADVAFFGLFPRLSEICCFSIPSLLLGSATKNSYDSILTSLSKPGEGEFGKYYSLPALNDPRIDRLPYSVRILLESAIRNCDEFQVTGKDVEKIIDWENMSPKQVEIPFKPARVLLQVNLEYLAHVVFNSGGLLYPDNVVVTDSHTTMIDGLGVAGWGVGGIEAEAAMLGQSSNGHGMICLSL